MQWKKYLYLLVVSAIHVKENNIVLNGFKINDVLNGFKINDRDTKREKLRSLLCLIC